MVEREETPPPESPPVGHRRRGFGLLLRFTLISLPVLVLAVIVYEIVRPLPIPKAVQRVAAQKAARSAQSNLSMPSTGGSAPQQAIHPDPKTDSDSTVTTEALRIKVPVGPLIADPAKLPPDLRAECDIWNGRFERLKQRIQDCERKARESSWDEADRDLFQVYHGLDRLAQEIDYKIHPAFTGTGGENSMEEWFECVFPLWMTQRGKPYFLVPTLWST